MASTQLAHVARQDHVLDADLPAHSRRPRHPTSGAPRYPPTPTVIKSPCDRDQSLTIEWHLVGNSACTLERLKSFAFEKRRRSERSTNLVDADVLAPDTVKRDRLPEAFGGIAGSNTGDRALPARFRS